MHEISLKKKIFKSKPQVGRVIYRLLFVSFFAPQNNNNFKLSIVNLKINKKIYIKQSYIILTWFYYLSFFGKKENLQTSAFRLKIEYFPVKRKIFTTTKAPMAHKTNSKEQFAYSYYTFLITFAAAAPSLARLNSPNKGLLMVFLTKKNFRIFETNLFFLKTFKFFFILKTKEYLNYHLYLF